MVQTVDIQVASPSPYRAESFRSTPPALTLPFSSCSLGVTLLAPFLPHPSSHSVSIEISIAHLNQAQSPSTESCPHLLILHGRPSTMAATNSQPVTLETSPAHSVSHDNAHSEKHGMKDDQESNDEGKHHATTDVVELGAVPQEAQKFHKLSWIRLTSVLIVEAIALGSLSMPASFAT